jgi:hypothetical protein
MPKAKLYYWQGKSRTLKEIASLTNTDYEFIRIRVYNGWSVSQAVNEPKQQDKTYFFRGTNKTLAQWSKELNLSYHTLFHRLHSYLWSVEKAFTEPINLRFSSKNRK